MLCSLVFLCCLDFGVWSSNHKAKIFSFLFTFFLAFLCLMLPWAIALLPRCTTLLLHHIVSLFHFTTSLAHQVVSLFLCTALLPHRTTLLPHHTDSSHYLIALLPLIIWLPFHLRYLLTPPLLFRCRTTLCWLVLPSSLLFCSEKLKAWKSKLSNNH